MKLHLHDDLMKQIDAYCTAHVAELSAHEIAERRIIFSTLVASMIAERDLYREALWKACGDDEVHVNAYLEAVKP